MCSSDLLVDTGANEIVRPYNHSWWYQIIHEKVKGHTMMLRLAGGFLKAAAMNQYGEIMMKDGDNDVAGDLGWILPVSRIVAELGMTFKWTQKGPELIYPSGEVISLHLRGALAYMN